MLAPVQLKVLAHVAEVLLANNILFQLTGGLAAIAYGARRTTSDLDIGVNRVNIPRVQSLFASNVEKGYLEGPQKGGGIYLITLRIEGVRVDIGQVENNCYGYSGERVVCIDSHIENSQIVSIGGMKLPVQNKEELILYKSILAREVDLEDIKQIVG